MLIAGWKFPELMDGSGKNILHAETKTPECFIPVSVSCYQHEMVIPPQSHHGNKNPRSVARVGVIGKELLRDFDRDNGRGQGIQSLELGRDGRRPGFNGVKEGLVVGGYATGRGLQRSNLVGQVLNIIGQAGDSGVDGVIVGVLFGGEVRDGRHD